MHILLIQHGVHGIVDVRNLRAEENKQNQAKKSTMGKYQISEESRKKKRFIRYRNCQRKKLLLLTLTMMTLINPPREINLWMNPQSDDLRFSAILNV